jgi:UTP--glucose-1-phosphate uridylyltransferase
MNVDVAVIPAAGLATRMLPATRVVPKALLTLVDRPVIQWVVEEGMRAGVAEFVVVVSPGVDRILPGHFEGATGLGSLSAFDAARITWVVQPEPLGLGNAVLHAREAVGDRPFFCLLGDNLAPPGGDHLPHLAAASDGRSVLSLRELSDEWLEKYGVVVPGERLSDRVVEVLGAVEKPGVEAAPSRLGLVGRYLFTPEVFEHLATVTPGHGGEYQLTDAIATLAAARGCLGYVADHDLLDTGTPQTYLEAVVRLGMTHPELGERFRDFLAGLEP